MQKTKRNSLWQHIYLFLVSRANSWDNENCETSCVRQDAFYLETISSCISGCLRSWSANFDVVIETLILAEQVNSWGVAQRDSHGRSQGSGNTFNIFSSPANHISLFTSKSHPYWSTLLILKWRCSPSIFYSPAPPHTHPFSLEYPVYAIHYPSKNVPTANSTRLTTLTIPPCIGALGLFVNNVSIIALLLLMPFSFWMESTKDLLQVFKRLKSSKLW